MRFFPKKNYRGMAPVHAGKEAIIPVNGIFSNNDQWQPQACAWGNANTPFAWSFFNYDAEALLTGFWMNQHADGLYDTYCAARLAGATAVNIVSHSLGAVVTALAMQRHSDMAVSRWIGLASADYPSFNQNGYNPLLTSPCNWTGSRAGRIHQRRRAWLLVAVASTVFLGADTG